MCASLVAKLAFLCANMSSTSKMERLFTPSEMYFCISCISSCAGVEKQLS